MRLFPTFSIIGLTAFALGGCATTTCDPALMSGWEILSGKGKECVSERRSERDHAQSRLNTLKGQVDEQTKRLNQLNREADQQISVDRSNRSEINRLDQELAQKRKELESLRTRIRLLSQSIAASSLQNPQTLDPSQQAELDQLQKEIGVLQRAIDRLLSARAQAAAKKQ